MVCIQEYFCHARMPSWACWCFDDDTLDIYTAFFWELKTQVNAYKCLARKLKVQMSSTDFSHVRRCTLCDCIIVWSMVKLLGSCWLATS